MLLLDYLAFFIVLVETIDVSLYYRPLVLVYKEIEYRNFIIVSIGLIETV